MKKTIILILAFIGLALFASAQTAQEDLHKEYLKKLGYLETMAELAGDKMPVEKMKEIYFTLMTGFYDEKDNEKTGLYAGKYLAITTVKDTPRNEATARIILAKYYATKKSQTKEEISKALALLEESLKIANEHEKEDPNLSYIKQSYDQLKALLEALLKVTDK